MEIFPDYYKNFKCIAGACCHSCCIGWEIDIDPDTLCRFDSLEGEFGERVRGSICREDTTHFLLSEDERCPFLNACGLCDRGDRLHHRRLCNFNIAFHLDPLFSL